MRNVWAHVEIFWNWRRSLGSFSQKEHLRSRRFSTVTICSSGDLGEKKWDLILECQAFTDYHKWNHYCFIVFPQSPKAKTDSTSELQNKPSAPWEEDAPQRYRTESSKMNNNEHTYSVSYIYHGTVGFIPGLFYYLCTIIICINTLNFVFNMLNFDYLFIFLYCFKMNTQLQLILFISIVSINILNKTSFFSVF